jgi:hypothetical protein
MSAPAQPRGAVVHSAAQSAPAMQDGAAAGSPVSPASGLTAGASPAAATLPAARWALAAAQLSGRAVPGPCPTWIRTAPSASTSSDTATAGLPHGGADDAVARDSMESNSRALTAGGPCPSALWRLPQPRSSSTAAAVPRGSTLAAPNPVGSSVGAGWSSTGDSWRPASSSSSSISGLMRPDGSFCRPLETASADKSAAAGIFSAAAGASMPVFCRSPPSCSAAAVTPSRAVQPSACGSCLPSSATGSSAAAATAAGWAVEGEPSASRSAAVDGGGHGGWGLRAGLPARCDVSARRSQQRSGFGNH